MKYQIDKQYLLDCFKTVADTPSPVGFYSLLNPVLEQLAADLGETVTYDNKSTPYITLEGQDNSKTVLVGAHSDTIGLIIKAHAQITRENSPIENVVIDLSCNGGGVADTAVFVIAWFLGEANIGSKDTMTGAVSATTM